jgi:hypothetical protein
MLKCEKYMSENDQQWRPSKSVLLRAQEALVCLILQGGCLWNNKVYFMHYDFYVLSTL